MAESAYPRSGAPMLEAEWTRVFHTLTGIISGGNVTADGSGLRVRLNPTTASVRGHGYRDPAAKDLDVDAGDPTARIDTVVLELDYTATPIIQAKVIKGTATAPVLTQTEVGVYQHPLADINVPASAVTIAAGNVTLRRHDHNTDLPSWSTPGRPVNPANGILGYNTTLSRWEWRDGSTWRPLTATSIDDLSDATTIGKALVKAATAATARGALGLPEIRVTSTAMTAGTPAGTLRFW